MASTRKSIMRNGLSRWQAVWREPGPGGTLRPRTRNFATQKEAKAHAAKVERQVERRGICDPDRHTVERYLHRWLTGLANRGEHSPTTLALYRRNIELACCAIGGIALEKLTAADLDGLYAALQRPGAAWRGKTRSPATVLHVHRVLHTAFEQARRWKLIGENPARDAAAPSARKSTVKAFTEDEVDCLLAAAATSRETYAIVVLLLLTAIRRSELLGLAWDAVDLDRGTIAIRRTVVSVGHVPLLREATKTESSARTLQIPPLLVELLRVQKTHVLEGALKWGGTYRRDPMFVFPQVNGEPHDPMGLTYRLRRVMQWAGITGRAPIHAWRHTAATLLVGSGRDVKTVQTMLGHSTPAITLSLYVQPSKERDREAGEYLASLVKR